MSRVDAAAAMDRLPWLPDDPAPQPAPRRGGGAFWTALGTAVLLGGTALWFETSGIDQAAPPLPASPKSAVVRLPAARHAGPIQPQVRIAPTPDVGPIVAPPMPVIESPSAVGRVAERIIAAPTQAAVPVPVVVKEAPTPGSPTPDAPWPVRLVDGAAGRLVRIGAFLSARQAKRGWWAIVRMNPSLKRLPALVVPVQSLRNGQVYYRLQMGTTSQAHSTVLCQRMRMVAQPCVVVEAAGRS